MKMEKKKLLVALLLCTAVSLPLRGYSAEHVFEGTYQDVIAPTENGGAIFNNTGDSAIVKASTQFINNEAYRGAGIYNYTDATLTVEDNVRFDNNRAVGAAGGAVQNLGTAILGNNLIFENNTAAWGGAAVYGGTRADAGSSTAIGSGAIFRNNVLTADASYGGAVFIENDENVNVSFNLGENSTFDNNSAMEGGAIYIKNAVDAAIGEGANFTNNTATSAGGAVFNIGNTSIANATFANNKANEYGGAVFNQTGGQYTVGAGSTYSGNSAGRGGAIYNYTGAELTVEDNVSFSGNEATKAAGGAIQNFGSATLGNNLVFDGNKAQWGGAAIYAGVQNGGTSSTTIGDGAVFTNNTLTNTGTNADAVGGAIFVENDANATVSFELGENAYFGNNSANHGGAIYFKQDNITAAIGEGATFEGNSASANGGAIWTAANLELTDANFVNNSAATLGGAIYNDGDLTVSGKFSGNSSHAGGAIYSYIDSNLTIGDNSEFSNNSTFAEKGDAGGALYVDRANQLAIGDNVKFIGNSATSEIYKYEDGAEAKGAAGAAYIYQTTTTIGDNLVVADNKSQYAGGGLYIWNEGKETTIGENATFINNTSEKSYGGAIGNFDGKLTIGEGATFAGNSAGAEGGAIANKNFSGTDSELIIGANSNFDSNSAGTNGGAIYTDTAISLTDTNFTNNTAGQNGGAIYANSDLTISAESKDVVMAGNTAAEGGDIYMNTTGTNLNLNAAEGKSITIASGISGSTGGYNMVVNSDAANTGSIIVNSAIQNAAIAVSNGTFHLAEGSALNNSTLDMATGTTLNTINNAVTTFDDNVTLGDVNLAVDVDLGSGKGDNFANVQEGTVTVTNVNALANTTANNISLNLAEALGIDPSSMIIADSLVSQTQTVLTPIRYLQGGVSADGMMTFAPTGSGYKDFNPAVMASPIAAQLGGYLTQLNSYDEAFRNMDMYMLMTKKQREALKLRNKYAAADANLIYSPLNTPYSDKSIWMRPYGTFENVPLKGGPKVSNVAYGSFFGGESELYDLGNGWDGMWGVYVGYNGSHQAYDGIGIYQNGGTLGAVGMAYKGNFFTGLTINAGANAGDASTGYGTDNFSMLMAGIASKTGYNIELAEGKFIIQPSMLMSYSFVNSFDYTNAAGVSISSDPLHAIQLEPGIKFIGNLKNGWQPYLGVSMVWNIMDKTDFYANNVSLPELSVKPFVKYGIGVRKTWGDRCTGFAQAYFTGGGRNGVGLQAGFRFTLGKGGSGKVVGSVPELPKTNVKLSNVK